MEKDNWEEGYELTPEELQLFESTTDDEKDSDPKTIIPLFALPPSLPAITFSHFIHSPPPRHIVTLPPSHLAPFLPPTLSPANNLPHVPAPHSCFHSP